MPLPREGGGRRGSRGGRSGAAAAAGGERARGAGRERRWAAAVSGAEGGSHHRGAAEKFWCGGPEARRGIMIGVGEGFPDTARYSWYFISFCFPSW